MSLKFYIIEFVIFLLDIFFSMDKSVSCIIPLFGVANESNWSKFQDLLLSIKESTIQFPKGSFELLFVNDELDVCDVLEKRISDYLESIEFPYSFVCYSNKKNIGQGASRNYGAENARNSYLHFIDQDDYVDGKFYSDFLSNNQCRDIYISDANFYIESNKKINKAYTIFSKFFFIKYDRLKKIWILLSSNLAYSPGQVIIKKKVFDDNSGFSVLKNYGSDDYGLFYRLIFSNDLSYLFMKNSVFYYRIHSNQNSKHCQMHTSVMEFISSISPISKKELFIHNLKKSKGVYALLNKIIYLLLFKRVVLK